MQETFKNMSNNNKFENELLAETLTLIEFTLKILHKRLIRLEKHYEATKTFNDYEFEDILSDLSMVRTKILILAKLMREETWPFFYFLKHVYVRFNNWNNKRKIARW